MEHVKADKVRVVSESRQCSVREYDTEDRDINIAVASISGRYPSEGWAINEKCTMMAFVLNGKGSLTVDGQSREISENDVVLILPGEKYAWDGEMTLLVPSTPAWSPEQYKVTL